MNLLAVFVLVLHLASSAVSVDTEEMLTILPSMKTHSKYEGEAFYVACESHGKNVQRVMWTGPDGNQITNYNASKNSQEAPRIHVEDGNSGHKGVDLLFRNITKKDRGRYTCSANVDGKEVEAFFDLTVYKKIDFMDTPSEQFLEEGKDSTLVCNVDGDPKPRVSWKMQGKSISKFGNKIMKHPDNPQWIVVKNVTLQDKGKYMCGAIQLTPRDSAVENFNITVKVHHKPMPSLEKTEESYSYVTGVVNLTCEAVAEPHANFTWFKDNEIITPSDTVKIFDEDHRSVLQLTVVNDDMFGDYDCQAQNRLGTMRRVVTLEKGEKPPMPKMKIKEVKVNALRLNLALEHNPEMPVIAYRVEYKKAGEDWKDASIREFKAGKPYMLDGLKSDTIYVLRTSAKNVAGYSDRTEDILQKTNKQAPTRNSLSSAESLVKSLLVYFTSVMIFFCTSFTGRAVS